MDKEYIISQHKIMHELENKAHSKKLEFERLFYKNSKITDIKELNKNRKRMIKLDKEINKLIEERNIINTILKSDIMKYILQHKELKVV